MDKKILLILTFVIAVIICYGFFYFLSCNVAPFCACSLEYTITGCKYTYVGYFNQGDAQQGWYYGEYNQKKIGTPDSWEHKFSGTRSAQWYDPNKTI